MAAQGYLLVHRIADRLTPKLRQIFLAAVLGVRGKVDLEALVTALQGGDVQRALEMLHLEELQAALEPGMTQLLRQALTATAEAVAAAAPQTLGITISFRSSHSAAVAWAQRHAADLVREITDDQRQAIRDVIAGGFRDGLVPRVLGRHLRNIVGLTERQMGQAQRFRDKLTADGVAAEDLERRATRYTTALLNRRADTIARTESIRAASAGQQALWDQAVDDGLLTAEDWHKVWITTPDDALCAEVCEEMPELPENQDVPINGSFTTGEGDPVDYPPAHVRCRCGTGLKRKED